MTRVKVHTIQYKGETVTVPDLARKYGLRPGLLYYRIQAGWDLEKALNTPTMDLAKERWEYQGKMMTAHELANLHGELSAHAMRDRLRSGMSVEEALRTPRKHYTRIKTPKPVIIKKRKEKFYPHRSAADQAKCRKCRYSEKEGTYAVCMYLVLHEPREQRDCEPGQNCKRFAPLTNKIREQKISSWVKGGTI